MPTRTVIIKKYENRRLYDTSNSRYVNLEDIAQMVREGAEVRVVDAASGEDLTRQVLTQIIAENAKVADSAFPLDMLRQMVIASGRMGQEGMLGYMKAMSQMYESAFRAFVPGAAPAEAPPVDELRRRIEELERIVEKNAGKTAKRKRARRRSPES